MPLSGEAIRLMNYIDDVASPCAAYWPLSRCSPPRNVPASSSTCSRPVPAPPTSPRPSRPSKLACHHPRHHRSRPAWPPARTPRRPRRMQRVARRRHAFESSSRPGVHSPGAQRRNPSCRGLRLHHRRRRSQCRPDYRLRSRRARIQTRNPLASRPHGPPHSVFATPTIRHSIADLASCTYRPDKVVAIAAEPSHSARPSA